MIKLYAKAAIYSPPLLTYDCTSFAMPELPQTVCEKSININVKHCEQYNHLTQWQNGIAAVVHPNYIQTLSLAMQLEMMVNNPFPFKPIGLVHIANQIDVNFLPDQNSPIKITTKFGHMYYHRRGWLFEVITSANVDGSEALTGTSFYLARHKHAEEANKYFQACHQKTQLTRDEKPGSRANKALPAWIADFGKSIPINNGLPEELMFEADIGRRYAKVSGDYNPIHLYPYTAKFLGFSKAIAHGMFSKAWTVSTVARKIPFYKSNFSLKTLFLQPIMLPLKTQLYASEEAVDADSCESLNFSLRSNKGDKHRTHLVGNITKLA